jgi:hypothetical protein
MVGLIDDWAGWGKGPLIPHIEESLQLKRHIEQAKIHHMSDR